MVNNSMAPLRIGFVMLLLQVVGIGQDGARLGKRDHIAGGCLHVKLVGRAAAAEQLGGALRIRARFFLGLGFDEGEWQARDEMSVSEGAAALGVTPTTVLRLIR